MANTKPKSSQVIYGKNSQPTVETAIDALQPAFAMAATFTMVPTTFQSYVIFVTQPHFRTFIWTGTKYERAPWHQPCQIFFSYDNPASISGALPVRADVSWQQADFPDVVTRLGLSGTGTFTLVETRGEGLRVLDNGRGVDAGRLLRSAQSATRIFNDYGNYREPDANGAILDFEAQGYTSAAVRTVSGSDPRSESVIFQSVRTRNIAFPLWMTI